MKRITVIFLNVLVSLAGVVHVDAAAGRIVLPDNVVPTHYDLAIVPDAAHLTFSGKVKIDLEVKSPTQTIELNAADLKFRHVALAGVATAPKVTFDPQEETATLTFPRRIAAGPHVLTIAYTGTINRHAAGLFALDYENAHGRKERALYTQFENSDARRFLPCWDEPAKKATFTLTATVPADEMPLSNMPIAKCLPMPGGLEKVTFTTSPKMSSYLLFFGLGDFERLSRRVDGIDVGVITTRGNTAKGEFALNAEAHILPYYEHYFGVKYPLPKLDLIAGPGQSQFFGAMENWGAIFFFERDVLIDPAISTEADKRRVYIVVAHETAHQWFGDLVTMAWWDDLWLNEGFAEWMETKATDHFHPEWKLWFDAMAQKEAAMQVDARRGTHPVIQPIRDVLQANEAFDTITYEKGQAVIWMLEDYVGDAAFRRGVEAYIKAHAYGNAVTDDLWRALEKTTPTPVTTIAHDFTLQAGVPLIRVARTQSGIQLTQRRFRADNSGQADTTWEVPVIEKTLGAQSEWHGLVSRNQPADIPLPVNAVPVVNAGQTGYYRTLYSPKLFTALAAHFAQLTPVDQLGLLNDTRALGYSGYEKLSDFLELVHAARPGMEPNVLQGIAGDLGQLATLYVGLPGEAAFDAFGQRVLEPVFARVGWEAKPGESQNLTLLRSSLLAALSRLNDRAVIAAANRRFEGYRQGRTRLSADLRRSVLGIVAAHATPKVWEELHSMAKAASSSLERTQLYALLGRARDPQLAQRALDLTLTDEVEVTTRPEIIRSVAYGNHPERAFDFALAHLAKVNSWLEPDSRNEYEAMLASESHDPAMIGRLQTYAEAHIPPTARQPVVKAESKIAFNASVRDRRLPEVDRWLAAHGE